MEHRDRTPDRSTEHDTGADRAERLAPHRQIPGGAPRAGYAAALVWALACLALYAWQLIEIARG